jgi:hypothetical protein
MLNAFNHRAQSSQNKSKDVRLRIRESGGVFNFVFFVLFVVKSLVFS